MTEQESFSQNYFDSGNKKMGQYASYEAARFYPAFEAMADYIKRALNPIKVLDIGCAKGYLVDVFREKGIEAFGVDISQYAIDQSPINVLPFVGTCDLNTEALPFPDNHFDCIICMGTLEYISMQQHALIEINRVLAKDGFLLMTTLDSVPEGDEMRKHAKSKNTWMETFKRLGFRSNSALATAVFSKYVKMIAEFEIKKALYQSNKESFKKKVARVLYSLGAKPLMKEYSFYQQKKTGYLMLAFQKMF